MAEKIKIDFISDVVCPWCIVGYNHLKAAIDELGLQDRIEIEWQPFELNPDMQPEGEELRAHLARRYGSSKEDTDRARAKIIKAGADYEFTFNYYEGMRTFNTLDAHKLLEYARTVGKQNELKLRLLSAHWSEKKKLSDRAVLMEEAVSVGLSKAEVEEQLSNPLLSKQIKEKESQWQKMGISSIPTMIFNHSSAMSGAQAPSTYKSILSELAAK